MAFLSSGPIWPAAIKAVARDAELEVWRAAPTATTVNIVCNRAEWMVVVTLNAKVERVGCAWATAVTLSQWWPDLLGPPGVGLKVTLPGMTFTSSAEVMAEVAAGCDRRTWLNLTTATIG